jgi:hypothetical protein
MEIGKFLISPGPVGCPVYIQSLYRSRYALLLFKVNRPERKLDHSLPKSGKSKSIHPLPHNLYDFGLN